MEDALLISIHPTHIEKILRGEKLFEYRKRLPKKPIKHLVIYATSPIKRIVAIAEVKKPLALPLQEMWKTTHLYSGIAEDFFFSYFNGLSVAHAFCLKNVVSVNPNIAARYPVHAPQSFSYFDSIRFTQLLKDVMAEKDTRMCFIAGVHGVGKTTFCNHFFDHTWKIISSSQVIKDMNGEVNKTKKVNHVLNNQELLCHGVQLLKSKHKKLALDGHFVLFDKDLNITKVPEDVFQRLKPNVIIVLIEDVLTIVKRLSERDDSTWDVKLISDLQDAEMESAIKVSMRFNIPLKICKTIHDEQFYQSLRNFVLNS